MTTGTMEQVGSRERLTDVLADLRAAHLDVAATVAEFDLDDAALAAAGRRGHRRHQRRVLRPGCRHDWRPARPAGDGST